MKVGILATGTELVTGDILNTNGQHIAQVLHDAGYVLGSQILATDEQSEIENALRYLMNDHALIIILGGLGPTTDDRTRFAVSEVIQQPLTFHESSWQDIAKRFEQYSLPLTENNRQQALFPVEAIIFRNTNGSANGCKIRTKEALLYLLPGPPNECLPMFDQQILPDIESTFPKQFQYKRKWRLFGVSESAIAAQLEEALTDTPVTTGYRVEYPYLEFKISTPHPPQSADWLERIENIIRPHLLADTYQPASQLLKEKIATLPQPLLIIDNATGGYLYQTLNERQNYQKLVYTQLKGLSEDAFLAVVEIHGLLEYWAGLDNEKNSQLELLWRTSHHQEKIVLNIPYRPQRIIKYATEVSSNQILKWLQKISLPD